jgi:hypothetical protein
MWYDVGREHLEQPDQSHCADDGYHMLHTPRTRRNRFFRKGKANIHTGKPLVSSNGKFCKAPQITWLQVVSSGSRLVCGGNESSRTSIQLPLQSCLTPNSFQANELSHWLDPLPPTVRRTVGTKSGDRTQGTFKPHQSPLF